MAKCRPSSFHPLAVHSFSTSSRISSETVPTSTTLYCSISHLLPAWSGNGSRFNPAVQGILSNRGYVALDDRDGTLILKKGGVLYCLKHHSNRKTPTTEKRERQYD